VYDALPRSSRNILFVTLADLRLLLISLFPAAVVFANARHIGTPSRLPSSNLPVLLRRGLLLP
jgi:hypothetical protein